jgi:2-polyprenyl-6-hydroxyphenyl methylase/3-demethylubiquinone-9 3-methyltransferase
MSTPSVQFDFGQNWQDFSESALTPERVAQSKRQFAELIAPLALSGKSFLDIGFGQGLGLLNAGSIGARTFGCDINPKCAQVVGANVKHYPELIEKPWILVGSILDPETVAKLRAQAPLGFDLVHSWGVLHHTGDMARAIAHAGSLVAPGGHLILAIYNRHWSSRTWLAIKWSYVRSPRWLQRLFIAALFPVIYVAKWIVTGTNPKKQERGMDFFYDVVDWVGGYPYEYASTDEVIASLKKIGFSAEKILKARVPTGCNEFVFRRQV